MARKFAQDFESLTNQSAVQKGNWADLSNCKQIDYGLQGVTGPITNGVAVLESCTELTGQPMLVVSVDFSTLSLTARGFQSSEPRPHGRFFRWCIDTVLAGGTITATINGQMD